jgi:hypothetical protein
MQVSVEGLMKKSLTFLFSIQVIISVAVYFNESIGVTINSLFLIIMIIVLLKVGFYSGLIGCFLLFIPAWMAVSVLYHYLGTGAVIIAPAIKLVFVGFAFSIGYNGGKRFGWSLYDFRLIGLCLLVSGILSLITGKFIGVEVIDITYEAALVGVSKHPAITAMLLASSFPFLMAAKSHSREYVVAAYICIILTMRRTAVIGALAFVYITLKGHRYSFAAVFLLSVGSSLLFFLLYQSGFFAVYFERLLSISTAENIGSGRFVFWTLLISKIAESSFFETVFGHGAGVINEFLYYRFGSAIGGHNDFIDLLFTFGLLPSASLVLFYLSILISVALRGFRAEENKFYSNVSISIVAYLIFTSLVSGGSLEIQASPLFFALGISLSRILRKEMS